MKKIMYLIGALSAMTFVLGWLFALLQMPLANELASYGFLSFGLVFMPIHAYFRYSSSEVKLRSVRLQYNFALMSVVLMSVAVLFKSIQLQGTETLLLTGGLMFTFAFLPLLFYNLYQNSTL